MTESKSKELQRFSEAEAKVIRCQDVPTLYEFYNVAQAMEAYARGKRLETDLVSRAVYVRLLAARRLGELVPAEPAGRVNPKRQSAGFRRIEIPHQRLSEFRQLASVPKDEWAERLDEAMKDAHGLVWTSFLSLGRRYSRKNDRERQAKASPLAGKWAGVFEAGKVYQADMTDRAFLRSLPESSVDMVMTDPPWSEEALPTFEALGTLACRVLKPGGFCATYVGHMFLPEVYHILTQHLDYVWTFGIFQPDSNTKIVRWHLFDAWRPIILLKKPGEHPDMPWIPDAMRTTRSKSHHDWEQGIEPALKLIEAYTVKGEIVLDPFVGSGTSLLAAKRLKRAYVGFDVDEHTARLATRRLNEQP